MTTENILHAHDRHSGFSGGSKVTYQSHSHFLLGIVWEAWLQTVELMARI